MSSRAIVDCMGATRVTSLNDANRGETASEQARLCVVDTHSFGLPTRQQCIAAAIAITELTEFCRRLALSAAR